VVVDDRADAPVGEHLAAERVQALPPGHPPARHDHDDVGGVQGDGRADEVVVERARAAPGAPVAGLVGRVADDDVEAHRGGPGEHGAEGRPDGRRAGRERVGDERHGVASGRPAGQRREHVRDLDGVREDTARGGGDVLARGRARARQTVEQAPLEPCAGGAHVVRRDVHPVQRRERRERALRPGVRREDAVELAVEDRDQEVPVAAGGLEERPLRVGFPDLGGQQVEHRVDNGRRCEHLPERPYAGRGADER